MKFERAGAEVPIVAFRAAECVQPARGRRQEQGQMFHAVYFRLEVLPGKIPEKKRLISQNGC